jgi:nucleotide-binding universal stress UspA family protein
LPRDSEQPFIKSILHPTDFSEASDVAFAHALAIALVRQTSLTLLHAGEHVVENWQRFPAVRKTLERWGLLAPGSPHRAVFEELSVAITKIDANVPVLRACLDTVANENPDLLVVATEGRGGLARFLRPSRAQEVARRTGSMTLFVPKGCRPMVSLADGEISLSRILIPVDHSPRPERALTLAMRAAAGLGDPPVTITHLHIGDGPPKLPELPTDPAWSWEPVQRHGDVVGEIVATARNADLVIMPTDGRDGPFDVFRGSHTERVVREIDCPLLAVPCG